MRTITIRENLDGSWSAEAEGTGISVTGAIDEEAALDYLVALIDEQEIARQGGCPDCGGGCACVLADQQEAEMKARIMEAAEHIVHGSHGTISEANIAVHEMSDCCCGAATPGACNLCPIHGSLGAVHHMPHGGF